MNLKSYNYRINNVRIDGFSLSENRLTYGLNIGFVKYADLSTYAVRERSMKLKRSNNVLIYFNIYPMYRFERDIGKARLDSALNCNEKV